MKKNVVRLTEEQLHKVIKEAVNKIISEGQGWDTFKYMHNGFDNDDYNDGEFRKDLKGFVKDKSVRDFIKHGGNADKQLGYYNPKDPVGSDIYRDGNKPINKTMMGKVGRAAGVAAGVGSTIAQRGAGKIKNAVKNRFNKKDNGEYDSFTM